MSKSYDFRSTREKLPPEAFAYGPEGPDPAPTDLIDAKTWNSITSLPDDVSIRTSDYHGSELNIMNRLWGSCIEVLDEDQDAMFHAMLDSADELQACVYNSLCGYYRVASSCLRNALELNTIGAYLQVCCSASELGEWIEGRRKITFGEACDHLQGHAATQPLERLIESKMGYSIFAQKRAEKEEGWIRNIYSQLSEFAHARPAVSLARMWEGSNGPVYVPSSFGRVFALYLQTVAVSWILLKLARPKFNLPTSAKHLFHSKTVRPSKVAMHSYEFLWGRSVANLADERLAR